VAGLPGDKSAIDVRKKVDQVDVSRLGRKKQTEKKMLSWQQPNTATQNRLETMKEKRLARRKFMKKVR